MRALHTMRSCIKIYSARTCERSFSPSSRSTKCNHALRSRALAPASAHFHLRTMSARTCERSFSPALLRRWKKSRQRVNARKGPKRVTFTPRPPFGVATTSRPPVGENSSCRPRPSSPPPARRSPLVTLGRDHHDRQGRPTDGLSSRGHRGAVLRAPVRVRVACGGEHETSIAKFSCPRADLIRLLVRLASESSFERARAAVQLRLHLGTGALSDTLPRDHARHCLGIRALRLHGCLLHPVCSRRLRDADHRLDGVLCRRLRFSDGCAGDTRQAIPDHPPATSGGHAGRKRNSAPPAAARRQRAAVIATSAAPRAGRVYASLATF